MLRNTPGFTAVAVLALALGIGANTAIFSVVNSVLLRPLPYPDADRMVVVWENNVATGWNRTGPAPPNYLDFRDQNRTFQDMCLFDHGSGTVTGFGEPEQVPGMRVTANFFDVFGAGVSLGRTFLPEEGRGGKHNVVIVSRNFWLRHFNGDPAAIGKRLMLDGLPYTIVGVLRADFWSPIPTELFAPWSDEDLRGFSRMAHDFTIVGRLKPGVPAARAIEDLAAIERRAAESFAPLKGWSVTVMPMQEALVGNLRAGLLVLLAAVGFVLLIACANLANLLLARSAARQRETALRIALGAGRARLVRQFLTESALLGLAGGGLGLLLALWGVDLLQHTVPMHIAVGEAPSNILRPDIVMDLRVLGFTLAVSLGTGLLFGILPALAASGADVNEGLKEGGRHTASASGLRLRNGLVVAETALALVLLIGAGLMIKSFWRMRQADPGFRPNNVLTVEMELPSDSKYRETRSAGRSLPPHSGTCGTAAGSARGRAGEHPPHGFRPRSAHRVHHRRRAAAARPGSFSPRTSASPARTSSPRSASRSSAGAPSPGTTTSRARWWPSSTKPPPGGISRTAPILSAAACARARACAKSWA